MDFPIVNLGTRKMSSKIHSVGSHKIIKSVSDFNILTWKFFRDKSNRQESAGNRHRPSVKIDRKSRLGFYIVCSKITKEPGFEVETPLRTKCKKNNKF